MLQDFRLLCKPCCSNGIVKDLDFCIIFKLKISKHCPAMGWTRWALKVVSNPNFSMIPQLIEKIFCFQGGATHALIQRKRWSTEAMKCCKCSETLLGFHGIRRFMLKGLPLLHSAPLRLKHAIFTTTIPVATNQTDLENGKSSVLFYVISLANGHLRQRYSCLVGCFTFINLCELQLRVLFESHCFDSLFWFFEDIFFL